MFSVWMNSLRLLSSQSGDDDIHDTDGDDDHHAGDIDGDDVDEDLYARSVL